MKPPMQPERITPERITLVRIQVDIPSDMASKLDQLKLFEGYQKRHVVKRALEELFKRGKTAL